MNPNEVAFFIGLFSSVHCLGMCGPLAIAIPVKQGGTWLLLWDKLLYNFGRIVTYSVLGLLTGLIGRQLWLAGVQQWISILSGVLVILAAVSKLIKTGWFAGDLSARIFSPFNRLLSIALKKQWGHFVVGLINGLLPCGFVYVALAGAINAGTITGAATYMLCFGLGTMPLMLMLSISSGFITQALRHRINCFVPYLMLCLGVWFVLRGLHLNIPYLSLPATDNAGSICR